jgi:hypothetical protein
LRALPPLDHFGAVMIWISTRMWYFAACVIACCTPSGH